MRDLPRLARTLGAMILVLTAVGIAAGAARVGIAMASGASGMALVPHLRYILAFSIVGVFGWMVCSGHRRARNYEWAVIGPYAVGLFTPLGCLTLMVNLAATAACRRIEPEASPAPAEPELV